MTKHRFFDIDVVHDALIAKVKAFIDPRTVAEPEPTILYGKDVVKTMPNRVSLYGLIKAHVKFDDAPLIKPVEIGGDLVAEIRGGLYLWIAGKTDETQKKCERYIDISRSYFDNNDLLGIPGCTISTPEDNIMQFAGVNVADVGQKPKAYTLGCTRFVIKKEIGRTVYTV